MRKIILLLSLLTTVAHAQFDTRAIETKVINGVFGYRNLITNPSCKRNVAGITGSSVAAVRNTTTALDGITDCTWNPTATSQTLTYAYDSLPAGLKGQNCEARILYLGDASLVKANVQINSVNVASDLQLTNSGTNAAVASINYPCGDGSTATTLVLTSTGDAANVQYAVYGGQDTSNWKVFSTDPTGVGKDYFGVTLPAGWIWASGKTIGNASSNATERANADTFDLFKLLWDNYSNSILPIYDSAGVASIRGASAAADFAANKALQVIDKRGRVSVGLDNLGGTAANRVTSTTMTPNGTTLGASGGEQVHALTIAELAAHDHGGGSHTHNILPGGTTAYILGGSGGSNNAFTTGSANQYSETATGGPNSTVVASQGSGTAHNTMQPSVLCNYIIKL